MRAKFTLVTSLLVVFCPFQGPGQCFLGFSSCGVFGLMPKYLVQIPDHLQCLHVIAVTFCQLVSIPYVIAFYPEIIPKQVAISPAMVAFHLLITVCQKLQLLLGHARHIYLDHYQGSPQLHIVNVVVKNNCQITKFRSQIKKITDSSFLSHCFK